MGPFKAEIKAAGTTLPALKEKVAAAKAAVAKELSKLGNDLDPSVPFSNDEVWLQGGRHCGLLCVY